MCASLRGTVSDGRTRGPEQFHGAFSSFFGFINSWPETKDYCSVFARLGFSVQDYTVSACSNQSHKALFESAVSKNMQGAFSTAVPVRVIAVHTQHARVPGMERRGPKGNDGRSHLVPKQDLRARTQVATLGLAPTPRTRLVLVWMPQGGNGANRS